MDKDLQGLVENNPIRKIALYKSAEHPMVYECGRPYGRHRLICSRIERSGNQIFIFVNKVDPTGIRDTVDFLWKTETSPEMSVEYDLDFDEV